MNNVDSMRAIEILLVEDSPTDRLIAVEALERSMVINSVNVVENGVDAMSYLRQQGKFANARRPDIILLDLNLPKKDGREVLTEIKADPLLKFIPVIVLTTSQSDEDVLGAYGNHANSYITKPVDFQRFTNALSSLGGYWFEVVTLPPEAAIARLSRSAPPRPLPPANPLDDTLRVLLIEDSPVDALLFREAIDANGLVKFDLKNVARLSEARDQLRAHPFDLVVTDLALPDGQGLETYRQVRECAGGVPIIVLTGLDDEETGMRALREGAQDYLVKGQLTGRALARAARYAIDKKRHQEQLRQAQRLEAVGRLAAGVAHDFNNILAVIRGNAELLPGSGSFVEVAESAKEIEEAADRAIGLARQLLSFSSQQSIQPRPLDLNQAVGNFTKMLRRILGEGVHLELQLAADLPAILADVGMLEQVLLNLAVNARDAMPGGGKFSVQTTTVDVSPSSGLAQPDAYAGRFAKLTAADTGAGMSPEVLERIFEPFFTTKAFGQGTGLGLATVHGIVKQHRGWLNVASRAGVGTLFEIFLPATQQARAQTIRPYAAEARGGDETILVVDDEEVLRKMAARVLRKMGYEVLEAGSVREALSIWSVHANSIALVFTDLVLPEHESGRQLADKLHVIRPALPIVFTSGYSPDIGAAAFPLEEGVNFLHKPYEMGQLVQTVRQRLDAARPAD